MSIDQLKKIVLALAEVINVIVKVANKEGVFVLLQAVDELNSLSTLDMVALKNELLALGAAEKADLVNAFKTKLDLGGSPLEKKIEGGFDVLSEAVDVVADALGVVKKAKALFA